MAVLEAWAHGKPALITPACNLPLGFTEGCALAIGTDTASIEQGMSKFLLLGRPQLQAMGMKGKLLVERSYGWGPIGDDMMKVYEWLCRGGPTPSCVHY